MATVSGGRALSAIDRILGELRKLPPALLPPIRAHWSRPEPFEAMAEHFALLPDICAALGRAEPRSSVPVIVISGAHLTAEQRSEHEAIARKSTSGHHVLAERGGHWVHLDSPEIVIESVRRLFHGFDSASPMAAESTFRERSEREGPEAAVSRSEPADAGLGEGDDSEGRSW
jgi:pimeloyl-ACP methyl ester carboxylesterase